MRTSTSPLGSAVPHTSLINCPTLQNILHILDDFFIAEPSKLHCLQSFVTLLKTFMSVKAPVVPSKTFGPSQVLEFMGIVLDRVRMETCLPDDKLARIKDMLQSFTRRSAQLVELQSLIGTSQFACKVVVPGRTFLQHVITCHLQANAYSSGVTMNRWWLSLTLVIPGPLHYGLRLGSSPPLHAAQFLCKGKTCPWGF